MVVTKTLVVLAALAAVTLGGVVRRHADGHHEPSFMEGLDDATKEKFAVIFRDHTLKGDAKDAALLNLATSVLKPEKLTEFKAHQDEWKQRRAQRKAEYDAKYAKLSPNAKKAADQLKAIWEDEKLSRNAKKAKKEEILKTLTDADRKDVENLVSHHGHHFMPKFMQDLPQETQDKFKAIWHDHSLKGAAKDAALTKLAESTLTSAQLVEFKAHMAKMVEWRTKMDEKLAKLSPNARKAADAMHAIWENDDLNWEQKKAQKDAIKAGLTGAEKAELSVLHARMSGQHGKGGKSKSEEQ